MLIKKLIKRFIDKLGREIFYPYPTLRKLNYQKINKNTLYAEMVKFSKNGSDVLSAAVRLARASTNRFSSSIDIKVRIGILVAQQEIMVYQSSKEAY